MVKCDIGYFSVYSFYDREIITFALLKVVPHVKYWWETYYEKTSIDESTMFGTKPIWVSFVVLLGSNITLSETMMTSTQDGPHYDRKGTKKF